MLSCQAGEGIYDQFDKVLLIDEGREVYFGPTSEARAYMVRQPMTLVDIDALR